jgi:hypothetical protein
MDLDIRLHQLNTIGLWMIMDISQIREIFQNWPSELDVAKQSGNWAQLAQSFFFAAIVLNEEMKNAHVRMHKNIEQMVSTDLLRRIQVRVPSIFCLAFSLELSIKAALVQQGDGFYQRDMINDEFCPQPNYTNKELSDAVQGPNCRNVP